MYNSSLPEEKRDGKRDGGAVVVWEGEREETAGREERRRKTEQREIKKEGK